MHVEVFNGPQLVADFDVDMKAKSVSNYKKYTDDWLLWPFTRKDIVTYDMFLGFLETRCPERTRRDIKKLLNNWGLVEFDPIGIVQKTHGLMFDDWTWIRFEGDDTTYDEIKVRDDFPDSV